MSQSVITNAFEALKAQQAANNSVLVLDEFVFANIPDLDASLPISRDESWPSENLIVHRQAVGKTGMVNANAVAYSAVLGADVGDFEFNWIGLISSAANAVCMIVHAPLQKKIKTKAGQQGNVLTRSFLMEYSGASEQTQIITPVDTWQIDFTARLNGLDERIRTENMDVYGVAAFLGDGYKVTRKGSTYNYTVTRGMGYIAGIRSTLLADQVVSVAARPAKIWVDVCWRGTLTSAWAEASKILVSTDELTDYDDKGERHFVWPVAEILANGTVKDLRIVSLHHSLGAINPQPDTTIYFDDQATPKLTALTGFIRNLFAIPNADEVLSYLGLKTENEDGITDAKVSVQQPFAGSLVRSQHNKNAEFLTPYDFSTSQEMIAAAVSSGEAAAVFNSRTAFTLTVGTAGDFPTLGAALSAAPAMRPLWKTGQDYCVIKLLAGYVHREQLDFGANVDLSWIKITAEDATVYTDTTAFTKSYRAYYEWKYMFLFTHAAVSPVFAVQFEESRADSDVCAFMATSRAHVHFHPYSGARKFLVGVHGAYGAEIVGHHSGSAPDAASVATYLPAGYYLCDFSYCRYNALSLVNKAVCNMPVSRFEHVTEFSQPAVNCVFTVHADFQGSSASHSYIGWNVRDGAHVNIRDHKTIFCTYRGLTMIHTAFVDARRHDVEETDIATSGRVLDATKQQGFYGCALGVRGDGAGFCDIAGNDMRNCGIPVNADTGFVISAKGLDISGASIVGFDCQCGSVVAAPRLWAKNIAKLCELKMGAKLVGRWINTDSAVTFETNTRFIDLRVGSEFQYSEGSIIADSGIIAEEGSRLTFDSGSIKVRAVRSFQGGHVTLPDCLFDTAFNTAQPSSTTAKQQYIISGGSVINVTSCVNVGGVAKTFSTTKNVSGPAGIIYDAA